MPHAWDLVKEHNPSILVLLETKSGRDRARQIAKKLHFDDFRTVNPLGKRGGIFLFWKNSIVLEDFVEDNRESFHALFQFDPDKPSTLITGIHAPNTSTQRRQRWRDLTKDLPPDSIPWSMMGYFNVVTNKAEKQGGASVSPRSMRRLKCSHGGSSHGGPWIQW